jgi:hypothetical protein
MSKIATQRHLTKAKAGARRDISEMFQGAADEIRRELARLGTGANGQIPPQQRQAVLVLVGDIVSRLFVGPDGRRAYSDENGAEPLAPYPRILSKWLVEVQAQVVISHAKYVRARLRNDPEILAWLERRQPARMFEVATVPNPIFHPDPLAQYEAAHTWVDPNGYRLSDRIWRASQRTRDKIDRVVNTAIREGWSSTRLADAVEAYLLPGRTGIRTNRPYDLDASYDAMRLARTEIGRAHAQASRWSNLANPYVTGEDYSLSASHPRVDICDSYASIGMGGGRIKEPYPKGSAPLPVGSTHPQCLCFLLPYVSDSPAQVTEQLREVYLAERNSQPPLTVVAIRASLVDFFGQRLFAAFFTGEGV